MKIRGSIEKINPLYSLYVLVGLLCLALPFRTYQLLRLVENNTGFYREINWSVYLMYALCILAVLVPYVLTTLAKNVPESRAVYGKNKVLAVSAFVFGAGLVADAVSPISTLVMNSPFLSTGETSLKS